LVSAPKCSLINDRRFADTTIGRVVCSNGAEFLRTILSHGDGAPSGASSRRLALAAERATGATPYRPLSCVTTNSKAAITTTAMSAIVIAISIAPPGWSSVSNRLCNATHQARTLLPPHRIGAPSVGWILTQESLGRRVYSTGDKRASPTRASRLRVLSRPSADGPRFANCVWRTWVRLGWLPIALDTESKRHHTHSSLKIPR